MTRHFPDLGSFSGWSCRVRNLIQPIRSTTEISVVTRHQYGISAFVSQTSFSGETSGSFAKSWLFSQAIQFLDHWRFWASHKKLIFLQSVLQMMTDDLMFRSKTKGLRTMYGNYPKKFPNQQTSWCFLRINFVVVFWELIYLPCTFISIKSASRDSLTFVS